MNKILIKSTIFLFILLSFSFSVFAVSNPYTLEELDLELSIPSNYDIITQDTPVSSPIFSKLGISGTELINYFSQNNIYLNAIPTSSIGEEIVVTMTQNEIDNFSLFSDTLLNTLASSLVDEYKSVGINVDKYDIYQHSQAKFIRIYFKDTINSVSGLQYYTVYDGKAMNFTIRSYSDKITQEQEKNIKTIVDSIKYNVAPPIPEPAKQTEPTDYIDKDTGVSFSVPANWVSDSFSKDREFLDVKFASTEENGMILMYGSTDLWSKMSASDKIGYTRSDFDSTILTKDDIAEFLGIEATKISKVTYNGIEYFQVEQSTTQEMYGLEFNVDMTYVVRIHNGWVYMFQFSGKKDNTLFNDFQTLLNTVEYPTINNNVINTTYINENIYTNSIIFFSIIIFLIIISIICTKKNKSRYASAHLNIDITTDTKNCSNCGEELPLESQFCHKCGTKLN